MAETPPSAAPLLEPSTPPSSAAEQARIRKERREAKIKAGGSARLNKITGLGGGIQRDPPLQAPATPPAVIPGTQVTSAPSHAADPEEVDISEHFYQPAFTSARVRVPQSQGQDEGQQISDEQLRAMMLGFPPSGRGTPVPPGGGIGGAGNPFAGFPGMEGMGLGGTGGMGEGEDPMLKLLQQIMGGGAGGIPGEGLNGMPSFPGMGGIDDIPGQAVGGAAAVVDPYAYVWRIVHALFALALGFYVAFTAEFTGTKLARDLSAVEGVTGGSGWGQSSVRFFYIFTTAEILLQTSRYFLEKGTVQPGGILGMVMGFLPQPWKGYLALILRYGRIWTTVSGDAMVCVFVLGVCSWLRAS